MRRSTEVFRLTNMHNKNCVTWTTYCQSQSTLSCRQLCHIRSRHNICTCPFQQRTLCESWNTSNVWRGMLSDAPIEFTQQTWVQLLFVKSFSHSPLIYTPQLIHHIYSEICPCRKWSLWLFSMTPLVLDRLPLWLWKRLISLKDVWKHCIFIFTSTAWLSVRVHNENTALRNPTNQTSFVSLISQLLPCLPFTIA